MKVPVRMQTVKMIENKYKGMTVCLFARGLTALSAQIGYIAP